MSGQLQSTRLYRGELARVHDVRCRPESCECGAEEYSSTPSMAVVRRGMFRMHVGRREFMADPTVIVFFNPGESYRVSHPVAGGDDCTSLAFSPAVMHEALRGAGSIAAERERVAFGCSAAPASPRMTLAVQALRRRHRLGLADGIEMEEVCLAVLDAATKGTGVAAARGRRGQRADTRTAHRRTVDAVRMMLAERCGERLSLDEIARAVHCSAFHLARLFRRETGMAVHQLLTRLRLGRALAALADGCEDLTELALGCGFASHSHLTDRFRGEFGVSPSEFRGGLTRARVLEMSKNLEAGARRGP